MGRMAEIWQDQQEQENESGIDEYEFYEFMKLEIENDKQTNISGIRQGAKGIRASIEVESQSPF